MNRLLAPTLACLLACNLYAENVKIVVNGREINTSVIESNGVIYVPVDALARALGASVTIQPGEVPSPIAPAPPAPAVVAPPSTTEPAAPAVPAPSSVTAPALVPQEGEATRPVATEPPKETPASSTPTPAATPPTTVVVSTPPPPRPLPVQFIKGKLTFNMNVFDPHGVDAGAEVWLVPEAQVAALAAAAGGTTDEPIPQRAVGWDQKLTEQFKFRHAIANERGDFLFANVAPGVYMMILLSKHANGLAARDRKGKMRFKRITVAEGQIVEAPFNFGMSALPVENDPAPKGASSN